MKQLFTRNFTLLLLGQASLAAGEIHPAVCPLHVRAGGNRLRRHLAGILAVSMVPTICSPPLGGVLADRANRRNIMVTLDTPGLAVLGAMAFFPLGDRGFPHRGAAGDSLRLGL